MSEPEVRVEKGGCAGLIVLNRPKALNALTLGMVRAIAAALDEWERDETIARVVVTGAGGRAFCAGGDIRQLYEQGRAGDHAAQLTFWLEEYRLNRRIKRYSKPYVALVDGVVMGGGVGLSAHGAHLVAGEGFAFAMPEVGIGFFPDVGATYLLPRLPDLAGVYLAMTGARAGAGDAAALGLAQAVVPSARIGELAKALTDRQPIDFDHRAICRADDRFAAGRPARGDRSVLRPSDARANHRRSWRRGERRLGLRQGRAGGDADEIPDQPGDRPAANANRRRLVLRGRDDRRVSDCLADLPRT